MATEVETQTAGPEAAAEVEACPLDLPFTGRIPAVLSLATLPGAVLVNPVFFGLAGGLLAVISLLLSPKRCRLIGVIALSSSMIAMFVGLRLVH